MQGNSYIHSGYRPDIDGLRAVAVSSVIAFHIFPAWIRGGFIGVDIFFVISGFLISRIIFGSLKKQDFSFTEFYARRLIRIFPALVLVLASCGISGRFLLLADEYKLLGKHIVGGATFVSNLLLLGESGYFDRAVESKPLLHLWSLGIEEQFYVVWPLLLWLCWKGKRNLLLLAIMIAMVSFSLNVYLARVNTVAAFYLPQTRFWELMAGSALGHVEIYGCPKVLLRLRKRLVDLVRKIIGSNYSLDAGGDALSNIQSFLGLVALATAFLMLSPSRGFPGVWAAIPTLGAVLIISAGSQAWFNRTVLSSRPLISIGLISYPLYLWHWPLLAFLRIARGSPLTDADRIAVVGISIVLSVLTYRLVEKPIRTGKLRRSMAVVALSTSMVGIGYGGYDVYVNDGLQSRFGTPSFEYDIYGTSRGDLKTTIRHCEPVAGVQDSWCRTTNEPTVALLGDSHADQMMERFIRSENKKFVHLISLGAGNCQPSLDSDSSLRCVKQVSAALDVVVATPSIQYVVISSWNTEVKGRLQESIEGYKRTFDLLRNSNKKIIYVVDIPTLRAHPRSCINTPLPLREALKKTLTFCDGAGQEDIVPMDEYLELVQWIKDNNPDVLVYDPSPILCSDGLCTIMERGLPFYSDEGHLSDWGGQRVIDGLIPSIESHFEK